MTVEIRSLNFLLEVRENLARCLVEGFLGDQARARLESRAIILDATSSVRKNIELRGLFACPERFQLRGTLTLERALTMSLL